MGTLSLHSTDSYLCNNASLKYLENLGVIFPDHKLVHFANVCHTPSKSVWWLEIPLSKIKENIDKQVSLALCDAEKDVIYHLIIPAHFIKSNSNVFSIRDQKTGVEAFSFELSIDTFKDIRPNGSGLSFKHFIYGMFKIKE
jgi:hypothetical protein